MMTTLHLADRSHPVVASAARELLNKSENERSGVLSTAMSFLASSRPGGCKGDGAMRLAHWRPRRGATPATLYLVVPPSDISRTKPLIRLVLNQIGRRLTEDQAKAKRRRLLLMLDEFPALGRLDFFESALAFMAGYGLKSFLIAQSLNQIEKAYGQNNSILDNCHVRVAFATNDERTAKRVSDALGVATELRAMKNYAGHRLSPWLGHLMVSRQETARPLLTAGEVMQLPPSDEVVLVSGTSPIRAKKVRYFEDRRLTDRVRPPLVWGQAREHKRMGMTGWRCQFPHLYHRRRGCNAPTIMPTAESVVSPRYQNTKRLCRKDGPNANGCHCRRSIERGWHSVCHHPSQDAQRCTAGRYGPGRWDHAVRRWR
jgi:type IV secretion system protein VirD4